MNTPPTCPQRECLLCVSPKDLPVIKLSGCNDDPKVSRHGESPLKKLVNVPPVAPIHRGWLGETRGKFTKFKRELAEGGGGDG